MDRAKWSFICDYMYHSGKHNTVLTNQQKWEVYCCGNGFGDLTPEQLTQINDGWDWSHIRDSDDAGVDRMYAKLQEILARRTLTR